jgi:CTP:molybdopterin cytidylyltransferase MocA
VNAPSLVILAAGRARRYGGLKQLAPIGAHGEAVIDLLADDAFNAGFGDVVFVVNEETGPTIRAHVEAHWPTTHQVDYVVQRELRGTLDAVASALEVVGDDRAFGVSNADDLYGRDAFRRLGRHLREHDNNCLIGFELEHAVVGNLPVSRGTCTVVNHHLTDIVERRNVTATLDGYQVDDGLEPSRLHPKTIVSMNLWGFQPSIVSHMREALATHDFSDGAEIQLSTFVGTILHRTPLRFDVIATSSRCIGVTHAEDLPVAQALVLDEVNAGMRPARAFA